MKKAILSLVFPVLIFAYSGQDIIKRPANSWIAYPATKLRMVSPPGDSYPDIIGKTGVTGVVSCWSGAAFDRNGGNLLVWGGGHNDYYGNELYAFNVDSLRWKRLTNPTPNPDLCQQVNLDGTPASRHTYNGLAFITHANRLFACGGSIACPPGGCYSPNVWTFDMATLTWHDMQPTGAAPRTNCENNCAYDPYTKKVYFFDEGLYAYDYDANTWTRINSTGRYGYTCAVDTKRHLLFNIGHNSVLVYDLARTPLTGTEWATTGGAAFISQSDVGLDYDPVSDRIVGWNGGAIYALNPETREWTSYAPSLTPAASSYGTYGRWRYVPGVNAFVNVNSVSDNVYFYKLTEGDGVRIEHGPVFMPEDTLSVSPNPFNPSAGICFKVPMRASVHLAVYDGNGRMIRRMVSATLAQGVHSFEWNGTDNSGKRMASGVYFFNLAMSGKSFVRKAILSR